MLRQRNRKHPIKDVGRQQICVPGILIERDGKIFHQCGYNFEATVAFMLQLNVVCSKVQRSGIC